jgi:hypothetical protein
MPPQADHKTYKLDGFALFVVIAFLVTGLILLIWWLNLAMAYWLCLMLPASAVLIWHALNKEAVKLESLIEHFSGGFAPATVLLYLVQYLPSVILFLIWTFGLTELQQKSFEVNTVAVLLTSFFSLALPESILRYFWVKQQYKTLDSKAKLMQFVSFSAGYSAAQAMIFGLHVSIPGWALDKTPASLFANLNTTTTAIAVVLFSTAGFYMHALSDYAVLVHMIRIELKIAAPSRFLTYVLPYLARGTMLAQTAFFLASSKDYAVVCLPIAFLLTSVVLLIALRNQLYLPIDRLRVMGQLCCCIDTRQGPSTLGSGGAYIPEALSSRYTSRPSSPISAVPITSPLMKPVVTQPLHDPHCFQ